MNKDEFIKNIESMSVTELNDLVKALEEKIRLIKQSQVGEKEQIERLEDLGAFLNKSRKGFKNLLGNFDTQTYPVRREYVKEMLRYINKIDVDFVEKKLHIYTRMPKYIDGEIAFEADPVIKKGRPKGGGKGGDGEGNGAIANQKIEKANNILAGKSELLVASSN